MKLRVLDAFDRVTQREHGGDRRSEPFKVDNVNLEKPTGNARQRALRALS